MNTIKLDKLRLLDFGNTIQLTACIYSDTSTNYLCILPDEFKDEIISKNIIVLDLSPDEWEKVLRQTDVLEVEGMSQGKKAILRKSQRGIDTNIMWSVYRRDHYRCRYCGRNEVPLTVDHIDLWENGGATVEENLLATCKQCNKARGNMPYDEWLNSESYKARSKNLTSGEMSRNISIISKLEHLKSLRYEKQRSR